MKLEALVRVPMCVAAMAAGLLLCTGCEAQSGPLPQRNLLIELRQTQDDSVDDSPTANARRGDVTIHSDGRIVGGNTAGTVTTRSRDASRPSVQQLQVLNGGRASMRFAHAEPVQFFQVTLTPRGIAATPSTLWHETGRGFTVHPRWPGGTQPVTVELSAEASETTLLTTMRMPLNEWVTIARDAQADVAMDGSTLSTQQISSGSGSGFALQMRISAPR